MTLPTDDGLRLATVLALSIAGPAVMTLAGLIICRKWRGDGGVFFSMPVHILGCSVWAALLLWGLKLRPVHEVLATVSIAAMLGDMAILLAGLTRPAWQAPRGFDVLPKDPRDTKP